MSSNEPLNLAQAINRLAEVIDKLAQADGARLEAYAVRELPVPWSPATTYELLAKKKLQAKVLNVCPGNERTGRTLILREELQRFLRDLPDYVPLRERGTS